ncbi:phosphatidylserine decarboxylase, partial [Moniliophthora roreri]
FPLGANTKPYLEVNRDESRFLVVLSVGPRAFSAHSDRLPLPTVISPRAQKLLALSRKSEKVFTIL